MVVAFHASKTKGLRFSVLENQGQAAYIFEDVSLPMSLLGCLSDHIETFQHPPSLKHFQLAPT